MLSLVYSDDLVNMTGVNIAVCLNYHLYGRHQIVMSGNLIPLCPFPLFFSGGWALPPRSCACLAEFGISVQYPSVPPDDCGRCSVYLFTEW